jgi:hypothetical protein
MKTRVLLYSHGKQGGVVFAVPDSKTLLTDLGNEGLDTLSKRLGLKRHSSFDWAAGDAGAKCTLLEIPTPVQTSAHKSDSVSDSVEPHETLPNELSWIESENSKSSDSNTKWAGIQWLSFPLAAKQLTDGTDRRYLQLSVQYISSGGVDNNVIAADADGGFLAQMSEQLKAQKIDPA